MNNHDDRFRIRKYKKKRLRRNRRWQQKAYNFLERPTGLKCFVYHVFVFMLVLGCLMMSVLPMIEQNKSGYEPLIIMEYILVVVFGAEYIVRLWSVGSVGKYVGFVGRLRFAKQPICLIDLAVVVASLVTLLIGRTGNAFAASAIRFIRFLQILRILHVDRQGGTWRMLGSVVYEHRQELITTLYIGFLALIFSSYFVYMAEHNPSDDDDETSQSPDQDHGKFKSYADALWWGVVTVTTIGYGDYVPKTWMGKTIASCFSIFAISFFALPAGTLGSGFALKVQQKQRQKQFNRQIPAAARLIQASWRLHAVEDNGKCFATWKIYEFNTSFEDKSPNHTSSIFLEHHKTSPNMPRFFLKPKKVISPNKLSPGGYAVTDNQSHLVPDDWSTCSQRFTEKSILRPQQNAIRAIRTLVYLVAKKRFQSSRRPYELKDVVETSAQGHADTRTKIKELQRRLDQTLGKPSSFGENNRVFNSPAHYKQRHTVAGRLQHLEDWTKSIDEQLDIIQELLQKLTEKQ